jgi:hypothetical protein
VLIGEIPLRPSFALKQKAFQTLAVELLGIAGKSKTITGKSKPYEKSFSYA